MTITAETKVAFAEQQLADATEAHTSATDALDTLKGKILSHGPEAVTAEDLGAATYHAEHAKLAVRHAEAALDRAKADARFSYFLDLKADILEGAGDPADALAAMKRLEDAAAEVIRACAGRQKNVARWTAALRQAGVGPGENQVGLSWSDAGLGRTDAVTVDGRKIGHVNAGVIIGAALDRAARAAGYTAQHLHPSVAIDTDRRAVNDPEQWLKARY